MAKMSRYCFIFSTLIALLTALVVGYVIKSLNMHPLGFFLHYIVLPTLTFIARLRYGIYSNQTDVWYSYCQHPYLNITVSCQHRAAEIMYRYMELIAPKPDDAQFLIKKRYFQACIKTTILNFLN